MTTSRHRNSFRRAFDRVQRYARVGSGFTLVETAVALVILGFALAGLSALMVGNIKTGSEARRISAAGALAQQKLEDLRAAGWASAASSSTPESLTEAGSTSGITLLSRSWTVANGTPSGTKDLTVTISWTDDLGSHQVQLTSKISQ